MALIRVYHDLPDGSVTPYSPWYRTRSTGAAPSQTGSVDTPLDLYGSSGSLYWRGIYSTDDWMDNNHVGPDGIGWVSLMAIAQNGCRGGASGVIGDRKYDLNGGEFRASVGLVSSSLRLGPKVGMRYWIQGLDPTADGGLGELVNLGYLEVPIDQLLGFTPAVNRNAQETKTSGFKDLVVKFDANRPWDWQPYGTSTEDAAKYGNSNHLSQLFESWDLNMGIHAFYGQTFPAASDLPYGHLNIRDLSLWIDPALNPGAVEV